MIFKVTINKIFFKLYMKGRDSKQYTTKIQLKKNVME